MCRSQVNPNIWVHLLCFERWVWTDAHLLSRPPEVFAGRSDALQLSSDVKPFNGLQPARSNPAHIIISAENSVSFALKV